MKMECVAGAALLVLSLSVGAQEPASQQSPAAAEQPQKKPGFWRELGRSVGDAGRQMVGLPAEGKSESIQRGNSAPRTLYTPISGAGRLNGLFKGEDHQQAQMGRLEWPRVALTFKEWGASMPCWTVEARIWINATSSTTETFQACADAPLTVTDDLGDTAELNDNARAKATTDLMEGLRVRPNKPNTGDQRTEGPNPPREPFNVRVSRSGIDWTAKKVALSAAWVSGFLQEDDLTPGPSGILTPFRDTRMWIAGFDPAGDRDK